MERLRQYWPVVTGIALVLGLNFLSVGCGGGGSGGGSGGGVIYVFNESGPVDQPYGGTCSNGCPEDLATGDCQNLWVDNTGGPCDGDQVCCDDTQTAVCNEATGLQECY